MVPCTISALTAAKPGNTARDKGHAELRDPDLSSLRPQAFRVWAVDTTSQGAVSPTEGAQLLLSTHTDYRDGKYWLQISRFLKDPSTHSIAMPMSSPPNS